MIRPESSVVWPVVLLAMGVWIPVLGEFPILEYFKCVYGQYCGQVSAACWTRNHPWGSDICYYGDGSYPNDLCKRVQSGSCVEIGKQFCGPKYLGSCTGTGQISTCLGVGGGPVQEQCNVPRC